MKNVQLSPRAYAKMLLHTAKYPHKAVNGVLLGEELDGHVLVLDAVPLFHICLGLAPMLEVALSQVASYCKSCNIEVVGYYQANEHIKSNSPDGIAYKIGEKICENFKKGFILMVDNQRAPVTCEEIACKCYAVEDSKWKQLENVITYEGEDVLSLSCELLDGKAYQSLVDFDNHLDDISQDWLNRDINRLLDLSLSG